MKAKSTIRRVFSIALVVVMLFSTLVTSSGVFAEDATESESTTVQNQTTEGGTTDPTKNSEVKVEPAEGTTVQNTTQPGVTEYKVTFFPKNNIEGKFTQQVKEGGFCNEPKTPSIPAGMRTFTGWYLADEEGNVLPSNTKYAFTTKKVTEDVYLAAQYSNKYLVQFFDSRSETPTVIDSIEVAPNGKVKATDKKVTPPEGTIFLGWTSSKTTDILFDFNTPIKESVNLYPVFTGQYHVFFDSTGGSAVTPQVVTKDKPCTKPSPDPTRPGYDFSHWSKTKNGAAFDFANTKINAETELFAVWKPRTVGYTVVMWVQDPNKESEYKSTGSFRMSALAGSNVKLNGTTFPADKTPKYTEFKKSDDSKEILGTGNTVVNVYFDRTVYTIYFNLAGEGATLKTPKGTFSNSADRSQMYSIKAKYEQDISKLWPVNGIDGFALERTLESTSYSFQGWSPPAEFGNVYWVSKRLTLTAGMIPASGTEYEINAYWPTSGMDLNLNYMFEALPGYSTIDKVPGQDFVIYKDKIYVKSTAYSQPVFSNGSAFQLKDIDGFTAANTYALKYQAPLMTDISGTETEQYLLYNRNSYDLYFDQQDGSELQSKKALHEDKLANYKPEDPVRDGYKFVGWAYGPDKTDPLCNFDDESLMPARDITLFARWESTKYTANFFNDIKDMEDSSKAVATQGFADYEAIDDPQLYEVGKPGFDKDKKPLGEFLGWYYNAKTNQGTTTIAGFNFGKYYFEDMNIYARWRTTGFGITYDTNGGTGSAPVDNHTYDLNVKAPIKDGSHLKYGDDVFIGWLADETGLTYYPGNAFEVFGDVLFQAKYVKASDAITLTYKPNYEGAKDDPRTTRAEKDVSYPIPEDSKDYFARPGHKFIGWTDEEGGSTPNYEVGKEYQFQADVTLYACWEKIEESTAPTPNRPSTEVGTTDSNTAPTSDNNGGGNNNNGNNGNGSGNGNATKTGDESNLTLYMILGMLAVLTAVCASAPSMHRRIMGRK